MSAKGLKLLVKHYILYGQNGSNVGLGGAKDKETMYSVLQLSSSPMIGIQRRTNVFNIKSYNIVQYSELSYPSCTNY